MVDKNLNDWGVKTGDAEDAKLPKLSEILGNEIIITGVTTKEGIYGDYMILDIKDKGKYMTSSKVIGHQLNQIKDKLSKDEGLTCKVLRINNYMKLE